MKKYYLMAVEKGNINAMYNLGNYYNFQNKTIDVIGNTGGLMMIRKNVFEKFGYFNENYESCFEDVHLNIDLHS